jgi:hypothetical protein
VLKGYIAAGCEHSGMAIALAQQARQLVINTTGLDIHTLKNKKLKN